MWMQSTAQKRQQAAPQGDNTESKADNAESKDTSRGAPPPQVQPVEGAVDSLPTSFIYLCMSRAYVSSFLLPPPPFLSHSPSSPALFLYILFFSPFSPYT